MFRAIKSNRFVRKTLYNLLSNHESSRSYKNIPKEIYFKAGNHFNLFFKRYAEIEPQITSNVLSFIKPGSLIFDIGANIGYYTIYFSYLAGSGKIVSIEPDPYNLEYLKKNVEKNDLKNVEIVAKAASYKGGIAKIFIDKTTGRTTSLERDAWHPNSVEIIEDSVSTITLDDLSRKYGFPDIIKCDVEGHEISVFKGGEATLSHRPVIFVEVIEKNREALFNILTAKKYKMYNAELPYHHSSSPIQTMNISNALCISQES
jgi:FkbM family methyltransferase